MYLQETSFSKELSSHLKVDMAKEFGNELLQELGLTSRVALSSQEDSYEIG